MTQDGFGDKLPAAFTWGEYVERWASDHGGWTQLADALIRRAGDAVEIAQDPARHVIPPAPHHT